MHLRGSGTKRCLKCIKNSFAIRIWKRKAPETIFFATMIFKYGKMILNWFTFLHVINALALISSRAIKILFFPFKRMMTIFFNGNCFFLFRRLPCCSFDYIFLIYLFLMAAFRHFARAHFCRRMRKCHKREFMRCLSSLKIIFLFFSSSLCALTSDFFSSFLISIELIWKAFFFNISSQQKKKKYNANEKGSFLCAIRAIHI